MNDRNRETGQTNRSEQNGARALLSRIGLTASVALSALVLSPSVQADDAPVPHSEDAPSLQPYIDQQKALLDSTTPNGAPEESYTESEKKRLLKEKPAETTEEGSQSYIDRERALNPGLNYQAPEGNSSYTETRRAQLPPKEDRSAIQDFKDGKGPPKAKYEGVVTQAGGFRLDASATRTVTAEPGAANQAFDSLYKPGWVPALSVFYEYQFLRSDSLASLGLVFNGGLTYQHGNGTFAVPLYAGTPTPAAAATPNPYATTTRTQFQFLTVPLMIGPSFRLNLLHYIQPYLQVGPALVGYFELRKDQRSGNHGLAKGIEFDGGINILLDWLSEGVHWDLYQEFGIHHSYLTVHYNHLNTPSGDLHFTSNAVSLGLSYEF